MACAAGKRKKATEKTLQTTQEAISQELLKAEIVREINIINRFPQQQPRRRDKKILSFIEADKEKVPEVFKKDDQIDHVLRKAILMELDTIKNKKWDGPNLYSKKVASLLSGEMCRRSGDCQNVLNIEQELENRTSKRIKIKRELSLPVQSDIKRVGKSSTHFLRTKPENRFFAKLLYSKFEIYQL